jgi:hypothetical protein
LVGSSGSVGIDMKSLGSKLRKRDFPPTTIYVASSLGDNGPTSYHFGPIREIPGFYVVIPARGASGTSMVASAVMRAEVKFVGKCQ